MASSDSNIGTELMENWQREKSLKECFKFALLRHLHCDVTFKLGSDEKPIEAHRLILTLRSRVFEAMLTGPMKEQDAICIPDIEPDIFVQFLNFVYTDDVIIDGNNVTGLIYIANKYDVGVLEKECVKFLDTSLTPDNACMVMEQAHFYNEWALKNKAMTYICENADFVLQSAGFADLCPDCVREVTETDELKADEDKVFQAVNGWSEAECRRKGRETTVENKRCVLGKAIMNVRYALMDQEYFVDYVLPTGLLTESEQNKILINFVRPSKSGLPFRANKVKSKLVCTGEEIVMDSAMKPTYDLYSDYMSEDDIEFRVNRDCCLRGFKLFNYHQSDISFSSLSVCDVATNTVISDVINVSEMKEIDEQTQVQLSGVIQLSSDTTYRLSVKVREEFWCYHSDGKVTGHHGSFTCSFLNKERHKLRLISGLIFLL